MSDSRITKFNHVVGNVPASQVSDDDNDVWRQIELQSSLILEEAQELYDAARDGNVLEVLDGNVDVWVTREYMDDLLESLGISVKGAKEEVCNNNSLKFTQNVEFADATVDAYSKNNIATYTYTSEYEGTTYYCVKRVSDNKVMKLLNHESPDIQKFIPKGVLHGK